MTAEAFFSHAGGVMGRAEPGPKPSRQQLLERERRRRMALLEERAHAGGAGSSALPTSDRGSDSSAIDEAVRDELPENPVLPPGFASQEHWQQAVEAAGVIASAAREAGHPSVALERERHRLTADALARAAVEAVRSLAPCDGVRLLWEAQRAHIPVLPDDQAARARLLLEGSPDQEPDGRIPGTWEPESETEQAWRRYAAYERLRYSTIGADAQRELLGYLPLSVVDDLIDAGRLTARAVPQTGPHRLYLQARLTPWDVDHDGLRELGWHSELARREFRARLAAGDISVLDQEAGLTRGQRELATALKRVRGSGQVTPGLAEKRWLWCALERLAPQTPVNLRRDKAFGSWLLIRRIQRALRLAHQAQIRGEDQKHETMLRAAWNDATALQNSWTTAGWEARNVIAYLLVLQSADSPHCEEALHVLNPDASSGMREDRLPGQARNRLENNRDVLRQLMRQHDRSHVLNPYLVLGVADGSTDWKSRWRELRRTLDMDGEALVNEAKDAIDALERGRASVRLFALPLMPESWAPPHVEPSHPGSGGPVLPRSTAPATEDERQFARREAAAAIVECACRRAGLPPLNEADAAMSIRESSSE